MSERALEIRISEDHELPAEVLEVIKNELKYCDGILEVVSLTQFSYESRISKSLYLVLKSIKGIVVYFIVMDWDDYFDSEQRIRDLTFNIIHKADFSVFNRYLSGEGA